MMVKARPSQGRFIQKIQCQETYSVKAPPIIGPSAHARAHTKLMTAKYWARSLDGISFEQDQRVPKTMFTAH